MLAVRRISQAPSFRSMLAERFNELSEENGECCALRWHPIRGFRYGAPDPSSADGEMAWSVISEAEVLAQMARMAADAAGQDDLARRLAQAEV